MDHTSSGQIILLNGTSSSGKSTLAKALQGVLEQPYLHIDGDAFWQFFPDPYFDGRPDEEYRPWRNRFLPACYATCATYAHHGINVIIDEVLTKPMTLTWLQEALTGLDVVFVGLHCGLDELEQREQARGNRTIGLARFQYPNIHIHGAYDLEVNTELNNPYTCAQQIRTQLTAGLATSNFWLAVEKPLPN